MPTSSDKTRKELIWERQERAERPAASACTRISAALLFGLAGLLRPFGRLRIGILHHQTMGRFYGNTEYFLRLRKFSPSRGREIVRLVAGDRPVNSQILKMIRRRVKVISSNRIRRLLEDIRNFTPDHFIWIDLGCTGWLRGAEWSQPGPQLSFTSEEHERGQALLRELGVPEGGAYVCIFAKDRGYSDNPDTPPDPDSYWGTKDFRNCDIKGYIAAAEYLAERGIRVLRMGVHTPAELLPAGLHPNIVDYTGVVRPTLSDPDFADTYLQATCKFFVGTGSGIYILSSMFGVPVAYANMLPYGECGRMPHDIVIFKNSRYKRSGELIPYRHMIARGVDSDWLTLDELEKLDADGVEFLENTPDEILALVREMNERLDGEWQPESDDDMLQSRFIEISPARHFDGSGFPGRVGALFLRDHRELI
ncbi:MAG: hypothetical protein CFH41_01271 [Alphaproteobacteria bacterium MarineAlpha11_Bin1]|nr:MAG: hypothetical protein CFH41_01271 [Alphaproteobacteria bacterium MarineAlpha11_Bin1]|tara:strand:- start:239 stop:1507 length:1269 start_codon:yes stop_codon:yes gene_type:complete